MNAALLNPFDPRGELAEVRDDAIADELDKKYGDRDFGYSRELAIDTTPSVGIDAEGQMTYSTLTPIFSDMPGRPHYGSRS